MLGFRITHSLSERDKLRLIELHRSGEPLIIDCSAEYGCQPFRSAKQIDVLTDEARIDRGVKPLLFVGDILHAIAMSDIDEIEGGGRDEILQACRRPNVGFQVRQQRVSLGSWSHTPSAIAV